MSPPPAERRLVVFTIVTLLLAAIYAGWTGVSLIWDGAYQLAYSLVEGAPFYHHTRYHSWVVWQPVMWLAPHTSSVMLLQAVYGAPYLLAPVLGVALSWWVVRNTAPHLILWAIFGVAATLPGQIFIINDSIFQQHLFWPVFLAFLVPVSFSKKVVLGLLAIFQLSHPIGAVLMGGTAAAAALLAFTKPEQRKSYLARAAVAGVLAAICAAKIVAWPDGYAQEEFTREAAMARLVGILSPSLVIGLCSLYAGAWFLHKRKSKPALLALLLTTTCWIWWATDMPLWTGASINYRRWVVPAAAPFFALAVWECVKGFPANAGERYRVAVLLPLMFAVVIAIQSALWQSRMGELSRHIAQSPDQVIIAESLSFLKDSPLDHWSLPALSLLLQRQQPSSIVLHRGELHLLEKGVPLSFFRVQPVERSGWFDWSALPVSQK